MAGGSILSQARRRRILGDRYRGRLGPAARGLAVFVVLALILALVGTILGMLSWLGPVPCPHFVGIWITDPSSPAVPSSPHARQDREGLRTGDYFRHVELADNLSGAQLMQEMSRWATLPAQESLVVFVSGHAVRDSLGKVHILPADASIDHPGTWIALQDVLEALKFAPVKHKLLVLDLMRSLPDPRLGVLSDEVAAGVPTALDAVADPGRLVLCACSPGQGSLASEDLGRSVFAYYLEEGLRGHADGFSETGQRDGFVTVRELADFVQARVDRWALKNRGQRQTPMLFGAHEDFTVVALPHGQPRLHLENAEVPVYPDALLAAWKSRDRCWQEASYRLSPRAFQQLQAAVIDAEFAWRGQTGAETRLLSCLAGLTAQIDHAKKQAEVQPTSLAQLAPTDGHATSSVAEALQEFFASLKSQAQGLDRREREELLGRLGEGFSRRIKDAPADAVARAVWSAALNAKGDAETCDLLDRLVRRSGSASPRFVEMVILRHVAELARRGDVEPWPAKTVDRAFRVAHLGEMLTAPDVFSWIRQPLCQAAQVRHDAEIRLWAHGFADLAGANQLLKHAASQYREIDKQAKLIRKSQNLLAEAMAILPWFPQRIDIAPECMRTWLEAVRATAGLHDTLNRSAAGSDNPREDERNFDDIQQQCDRLQESLDSLNRPYLPRNIEELERLSRLPRANADVHRQIEALLAVPHPLLTAERRAGLLSAGRLLARRLHAETVALDRSEDGARQGPRSTPPSVNQEVPYRRAQVAIALAELGGVKPVALPSLRSALQQARDGSLSWSSLGNQIRNIWTEQLPATAREAASTTERVRLSWIAPPRQRLTAVEDLLTSPALALTKKQTRDWWEWLSQHYQYQARDYQGSGLEGEIAVVARQFYQQAAFANPKLYQPGPDRSLAIRARQLPSPLSLLYPQTRAVVEIKPLAGARGPGRFQFDAIKPAANWLDITPETVSFAAFESSKAPSESKVIPLRIGLKRTEERGRGSRPQGFLVQATYAERNYHLLVPVPLQAGPSDLQVLLGTNAAQPEPALTRLRLRPGNVPQSFHVFAQNPSARQRNVIVQVRWAGRLLAESKQPLTLEAGETRRVSLADRQTKSPGLDDRHTGALHLLLFDADRNNAILDSRHIEVGIASPSEYVHVEEAVLLPGQGPNRYGVSIRLQAPSLNGAPVPVELMLPAERKGKGTFRGQLIAGKGALTLFAEGASFPADATGADPVVVSVDGVPRVFAYTINWGPKGAFLAPDASAGSRLRLIAPSFALPQCNLALAVEVDRAPTGSALEVRLGRIGHAGFEADVVREFPADKQRTIDLQLHDTLVFRASLRDWEIQMDTSKILGQRLLQARLLDDQGKDIQLAMQALTIDDSVPGKVRFLQVPAKAKRGSTLPVRVVAESESGIAQVKLFVGRPVEGKVPSGTRPLAAHRDESGSGVWRGDLSLPNQSGPVAVTALIGNHVGKSVFATTVVELTDVDPALLGNGAIQGVVTEGGRPQPGLEVLLVTESGQEIARTRSAPGGTFRFDDVPPGRCFVRCFKPASGRRAATPALVLPNQMETVTLALTL